MWDLATINSSLSSAYSSLVTLFNLKYSQTPQEQLSVYLMPLNVNSKQTTSVASLDLFTWNLNFDGMNNESLFDLSQEKGKILKEAISRIKKIYQSLNTQQIQLTSAFLVLNIILETALIYNIQLEYKKSVVKLPGVESGHALESSILHLLPSDPNTLNEAFKHLPTSAEKKKAVLTLRKEKNPDKQKGTFYYQEKKQGKKKFKFGPYISSLSNAFVKRGELETSTILQTVSSVYACLKSVSGHQSSYEEVMESLASSLNAKINITGEKKTPSLHKEEDDETLFDESHETKPQPKNSNNNSYFSSLGYVTNFVGQLASSTTESFFSGSRKEEIVKEARKKIKEASLLLPDYKLTALDFLLVTKYYITHCIFELEKLSHSKMFSNLLGNDFHTNSIKNCSVTLDKEISVRLPIAFGGKS